MIIIRKSQGIASSNINDIVEGIEQNNYNLEKIQSFKNKYIDLSKNNNTSELVDIIIQILESEL